MAGGRVGIITKRFDSLSYNERMCTKHLSFYFLLHCSIQRHYTLLFTSFRFPVIPSNQMGIPELKNGLYLPFRILYSFFFSKHLFFHSEKNCIFFSITPNIPLIILIASFWCCLPCYFFSPCQQLEF